MATVKNKDYIPILFPKGYIESMNEMNKGKLEHIWKEIEASSWFDGIKEYIENRCKQINITKYMQNNQFVANLIFNIFFWDKPLFLIKKPKKEPQIRHFDTLTTRLTFIREVFIVDNILWQIRKQLSNKADFIKSINAPVESFDDYQKVFRDIQNLKLIEPEFKNAKVSIKMRDGKPIYMEGGIKTHNTDFIYRKDTLGPHRKIEENTEDGDTKSLDVKRKHKYGKKKGKR